MHGCQFPVELHLPAPLEDNGSLFEAEPPGLMWRLVPGVTRIFFKLEGGRSSTTSEEYVSMELNRIFLPSESNRMQAGRKWRDRRLCPDDRGVKGLRHEDIYPLRSELSTPVRSNKAETTTFPWNNRGASKLFKPFFFISHFLQTPLAAASLSSGWQQLEEIFLPLISKYTFSSSIRTRK